MSQERDIDDILASLDQLLREGQSQNGHANHAVEALTSSQYPSNDDASDSDDSDGAELSVESEDLEAGLVAELRMGCDASEASDAELFEVTAEPAEEPTSNAADVQSDEVEKASGVSDELMKTPFEEAFDDGPEETSAETYPDGEDGVDEDVEEVYAPIHRPRVVLTEDMLVDDLQVKLPLNTTVDSLADRVDPEHARDVKPSSEQEMAPQLFPIQTPVHENAEMFEEADESPDHDEYEQAIDLDTMIEIMSASIQQQVLEKIKNELDSSLPDMIRQALEQSLSDQSKEQSDEQ